ncbi:MAG: hypothetical protein ACYC49_05250 [Ignavibacteriaceae bacterium]
MSEEVTVKEYWEQIDFYSEMVIEKAKDQIERLKEIIKNLDNLPPTSFEKLLAYLSSTKIIEQSDDLKVNLWNTLVYFTSKHKKFSDAKWALKPEIISKIDIVAKMLEPKNPLYLYARLFSGHDSDLYEEKDNWDEQQKRLDERRQDSIKVILDNGGIEAILVFLENVESPTIVGYALAVISEDLIDEKILPKLLEAKENKVHKFISAYVWRKYYRSGWGWVDGLVQRTWTKVQISCFLTYLPFIQGTWERVTKNLSDSENLYWEKTIVNPYQTNDDLTLAIDKLIKYGRPRAALDCINKLLFDKKPLDIIRAITALKASLSSKEPINSMDSYHITEIIKTLQNEPLINEEDLFFIEWNYLPLLDEQISVSPKTLELRLSSDPAFFSEVIRLIYRSKNATKPELKESTENEQAIVKNAWDLLYKWKIIPGIQKDGTFNEKKFGDWINKMWAECESTGHLEVALSKIGQVLYYSPEDPSGFWINKTIAEFLNRKDTKEARNGFSTEVFNSRGAYWVDPTGKPELELAKTYRKKAEDTEDAGFQRFAITLRKIAESYEEEAKQIVAEHNREMNE